MVKNYVFLTFLLALSSFSLSKPSPENQYGQDDTPSHRDDHKPNLHRVQLEKTNINTINLIPQTEIQPKNADLQVDLQEKQKEIIVTRQKRQLEAELSPHEVEETKKKRETEVEDLTENIDTQEKERKKRNYVHWFGQTNFYTPPASTWSPYSSVPSLSPYSSFPFYRNPTPQVVIPLFGGQLPVFFPPKPILFNPGYPIYNRPRPERPIRPIQRENETDVLPEIPNRFGDPNLVDDIDHPVWGVVEDSNESTATTRRPQVQARPTKPPVPPLFHNPSLGDNVDNDLVAETPQRPQSRPRPTERPQTTTTQAGKQLDRCVWAIITCCNPTNDRIRYSCFENAGCQGAFWDRNPCSREITLEALDAAQKFYETQS